MLEKRALLWTSVNTDVVGANQKIPVIVCTADNKYYVAESTTANVQDMALITLRLQRR